MTFSYSHGASATPLLGETIGNNLRRTVERVPDAEALVVRSQSYRATYRELWDLTGRAARGLLAHGVAAGDRVGLWAPNRHEWVIAQFAAARIGAILVNINPAYRAGELHFALTKSGVSVLLLARDFRSVNFLRTLAEVRPNCPDLRETIALDDNWPALLAAGDRVPVSDLAVIEGASNATTRSISSTHRGPLGTRRPQPSRTTVSLTTRSSLVNVSASPNGTGSASRCRSTIASAWSWAPSPARPTARAW
jgi:acyl-CoA synthetase (AMP-forming)/AMP-acid ligase II